MYIAARHVFAPRPLGQFRLRRAWTGNRPGHAPLMSRARPRPVAGATRSQSRNIRASFAGTLSRCTEPSSQHQTRSAHCVPGLVLRAIDLLYFIIIDYLCLIFYERLVTFWCCKQNAHRHDGYAVEQARKRANTYTRANRSIQAWRDLSDHDRGSAP